MPHAALVEELERVRGDRRVADPEHLQLGGDGLVGPARHVRVHRERGALVQLREVLRGGRGVDALRPRLREVRGGLLRELLDPALELLQVPRDPAAPELDLGRGRSELRVAGRLDALERLEHGRADRLAELVPALEAVPARLAVPEPVVPARDVAAAALEEEALAPADRPRRPRGAGPGSPCSRAASRRRSASGGRRSSRRRRSGCRPPRRPAAPARCRPPAARGGPG